MYAKELGQLYWLGREIAMYVERLEAFERDGYFPGMAPPKDFDQLVALFSTIGKENIAYKLLSTVKQENTAYKTWVERHLKRITKEYRQLKNYIDNISDPYTQQISTLRYVQGLGFPEIASQLGGFIPATTLEQTLMRYTRKHPLEAAGQ